jgi:DNA-binding transcriptional LysR family regulator
MVVRSAFVDLTAVRTFVTVVATGQFQEAAGELSITQQAVSKRVAALEKDLGVRLFARTPRGVQLTVDGQAFLPHAKELVAAAARALAAVHRRPLRVDVLRNHLAPAVLMRDFHRAHPALELDVATLFDATTAIEAVRTGSVDASFRALTAPPSGVAAVMVRAEPLQLLTGSAHPLASAPVLGLADLVGHPIWMPGVVPGTEWAAYYAALATAFDLTIDVSGPNFGVESLLDALAEHPTRATFVGSQTLLTWPAAYGLRRIPLRNPIPVYPHSLLWRADNSHPALTALRTFLVPETLREGMWAPEWIPCPK